MMARKQRSSPRSTPALDESVGGRIVVENVNHPGTSRSVDAARYRAMRRAILKVLPTKTPGLTLADTRAAVLPLLPDSLFPGGVHAGWWFKTVQLDLEAKGVIARERATPLRVHVSGPGAARA
jgi:hypothetical protein